MTQRTELNTMSSVLRESCFVCRTWQLVFHCRNGASNDPCDKPRHGYVLGNISLESNGNNGEAEGIS